MPPIRFNLWWSESDHKTFQVDSDHALGDIVTEIKEQLGPQLPECNAQDCVIEYSLFKETNGQREPLLARKRTLTQLRILEGDQLFLADRHGPWWEQPAPLLHRRAIQTPRMPFAPRSRCQLQLAPGVLIDVPQSGLELSRAYLVEALPQRLVKLENAKHFAGLTSRLHAVSRKQHCDILPQSSAWLLRAHDLCYAQGRELPSGATTPLTAPLTLVLGRAGWPIHIRLL